MTDIEQQEFAVVKAALTATLEFLVVEVNWEGFREEFLSLANCYGGAGLADKRAVKVG